MLRVVSSSGAQLTGGVGRLGSQPHVQQIAGLQGGVAARQQMAASPLDLGDAPGLSSCFRDSAVLEDEDEVGGVEAAHFPTNTAVVSAGTVSVSPLALLPFSTASELAWSAGCKLSFSGARLASLRV